MVALILYCLSATNKLFLLWKQFVLILALLLVLQKSFYVKQLPFLLCSPLHDLLLVFEFPVLIHAFKDVRNNFNFVLLYETKVLLFDVVVFQRHKHLVDQLIGPKKAALLVHRLCARHLFGLIFEITTTKIHDSLCTVMQLS